VLDQTLTRPEAESEEVAEHKETFLEGLKKTGSSQKVHNIVMCNKVENELYKLRAQEKRNKRLLLNS
jgi:hypothetical protein